MPYDGTLAARVRDMLAALGPVEDRKMFGGLTFMRKGRMCCGVLKTDLVVKLSPELAAQVVTEPHVRPMDFTGRPMPGMLYVAAAGVATDAALGRWVTEAAQFVDSLPPR